MMKLKSKLILLIGFPFLLIAILGLYLLALNISGNFHEVIPGELYRSAQVEPGDITRYTEKYHIKSILNLRGDNTGKDWYDNEIQEARANNLTHVNFRMSSKRQLTKEQALALIEVMRNTPKPVLIHCQGGADRTGLASALYLARIKNESEFKAELQLSPLYGHYSLWFSPAYAMNRTFESLEPYLGYAGS